MGNFKYWKVGKNRVYIIERYGMTTLVEYVSSGIQASVSTSIVIACRAKPYISKNPKKETPPVVNKAIENNNNQLSFEL